MGIFEEKTPEQKKKKLLDKNKIKQTKQKQSKPDKHQIWEHSTCLKGGLSGGTCARHLKVNTK